MGILDKIYKSYNELPEPQIEGIVHTILKEQPVTSGSLIRSTGLPKETLRKFKIAISPFLEDTKEDKISFKQKFVQELSNENPQPYKWSLVSFEREDVEEILKGIRNSYGSGPKRKYDQFFATEESTVKKALVMKERGDIKGRRIALLGDDDLLSVALGLLGIEYSQILVLDIDKELLKSIDKAVEEHGLHNIRTEFYDARRSLRPDLRNRFDVVVTDPPYTVAGVNLFLQRSLDLISAGLGGRLYFYYGNSYKTPEKTFKIQESITAFGLLILEKIDRFISYYGAESIGSSSSLYLLERGASASRNFQYPAVKEIYTYQKRHEADFPFVEHFVFKIYDVPDSMVNSKSRIQKALGKFCQYHKLKVVNTEVTRFSGGGYTFNYTLSNSNLTVHTWPELNALHFVLVTCTAVVNPERLHENLSSLFKTEKIEIEKIE